MNIRGESEDHRPRSFLSAPRSNRVSSVGSTSWVLLRRGQNDPRINAQDGTSCLVA